MAGEHLMSARWKLLVLQLAGLSACRLFIFTWQCSPFLLYHLTFIPSENCWNSPDFYVLLCSRFGKSSPLSVFFFPGSRNFLSAVRRFERIKTILSHWRGTESQAETTSLVGPSFSCLVPWSKGGFVPRVSLVRFKVPNADVKVPVANLSVIVPSNSVLGQLIKICIKKNHYHIK